MQQHSLDCHSFFRLIDANCSHISLHCIYPVGTVLLHFLIFCGHPIPGPAIIVVAFVIVALGGIQTNQCIAYCY
jgi:hypothetical protein